MTPSIHSAEHGPESGRPQDFNDLNAALRAPTLADFLLARIAEDEAVAREAMGHSLGRWDWSMNNPRPYRTFLADERGSIVLPAKNDDVFPSHGAARHIARHDPDRVLARCAADRRIVESLARAIEYDDGHPGGGPSTTAGAGRRVLLHLATVYADHPDYREEWRP